MAEAERLATTAKPRFSGGIVNRLIARLERLPSGGVPWVLGVAIVLAAAAQAASWLAGETATGDVRTELLVPIPLLALFLLMIVVLDGVAQGSFDEFSAALDEPAETLQRLRADLTSIPDIPAVIAVVAWNVIAGGAGQDAGGARAEPPISGTMLAAFWFATNTAFALLIVHTLRQLRQVGRLLAMIAKVNLLDPGPINAFSRLTGATAASILTIGVLFAVVDAAQPTGAGFGVEILIAGIAAAFFILPLRGMHGRLAAERGRRLAEANERIRRVIEAIHRMVDSDDLTRADQLQKAEGALLAERDLYFHLSTWPWSTTTFRGLTSAVMLPILIGIVLRLLTHVI